VTADLGNFGEVVYNKILEDVKKIKFQGFRAGVVPAPMLPKYRELALDETAREAVLEAMEQHNIKPSEGARAEFRISEISIPPKNKKEQDWRVFSSPQEAVVAGWKVRTIYCC